MWRSRFSLDNLANLALVITCAIAVVVLVRHERGQQPGVAPQSNSPFEVGKPVKLVALNAYTATPYTLLMYVRSGCHYCTESMSFYRTMRSKQASVAGRLRLVAVSAESKDVSQRYLTDHGLSVDEVESYPQIVPTPTMVLVDSKGVVHKSWLGMLNDAGQQEVLGEIAKLERAGS